MGRLPTFCVSGAGFTPKAEEIARLRAAAERVAASHGLGQTDLADKYTLEVSSPGLDRPLRHEADYRRFAGRLARIVTSEPIERQSAFAGRIAAVENGAVLLEEGRKTHRVPLVKIKRAHLAVEF